MIVSLYNFFHRFLSPRQFVEESFGLGVSDLPGVGWRLREKFDNLKISSIADLRNHSSQKVKQIFGQNFGQKLIEYSLGNDNRVLENKERQTIGAEVNWGVRFKELHEVLAFLKRLSIEVFES